MCCDQFGPQNLSLQLGMSILAEISRAYDRMKVLIFDKVSISRYLRKMFLTATFDWSNVYTQINWGGYSISFSVICNMIQSRGSNTFLFIRSNYGKCCNFFSKTGDTVRKHETLFVRFSTTHINYRVWNNDSTPLSRLYRDLSHGKCLQGFLMVWHTIVLSYFGGPSDFRFVFYDHICLGTFQFI